MSRQHKQVGKHSAPTIKRAGALGAAYLPTNRLCGVCGYLAYKTATGQKVHSQQHTRAVRLRFVLYY